MVALLENVLYNGFVSGYSIVVIHDLPKVKRGVRFSLPALKNIPSSCGGGFVFYSSFCQLLSVVLMLLRRSLAKARA